MHRNACAHFKGFTDLKSFLVLKVIWWCLFLTADSSQLLITYMLFPTVYLQVGCQNLFLTAADQIYMRAAALTSTSVHLPASFKHCGASLKQRPEISSVALQRVHTCDNSCPMRSLPGRCRPPQHHCTRIHLGRFSTPGVCSPFKM